MANRNIDTLFFKSPFVRGLEAPLKTLYLYIICDAEHTGIWIADFDIASIYIGQKVTEQQFINAFVKTGKAYDLGNGKYFFPDYIAHQQPKGLSLKNPAHTKIIEELTRFNLLDENLNVTLPKKDPLKGLQCPICNSNCNGSCNGKVNVKAPKPKKEKDIPTVDDFIAYGLTLVNNNAGYKQPLEAKYNAWVEAGWKDGHGVSILNWKTKLQNTIQYMKPMQTQQTTPLTEELRPMKYDEPF